MNKNIKQKLTEMMKAKGVKIPQLSRRTGIPADRIYKWYQLGTNPKAEDIVILEKWINSQGEINNLDDIELLKKQVIETTALVNVLLVEVAKLKARAYGIPQADDIIDELEQSARIAKRQVNG